MTHSETSARPPAPGETTDVFISYAHRDHDFVSRLDASLRAGGRSTWVDWEGIPPSAEWMAEIERAIVHTQAFLFVVSRHSAASAICRAEADIAVRHHKKLIPVVAETVEPQLLPPEVAARQWIDAGPTRDFAAAVLRILATVDTDLDWIRIHTRLLQEATRWQADRTSTSLLDGRELADAETWLAAGATHESQPTADQVAFIEASRWAAGAVQARQHYERSFGLATAGRPQAAAAELLRAVEVAPRTADPTGNSAGDWASHAWTAYRYPDAERGHLRGRLTAVGPVSGLAFDGRAELAAVAGMTGGVRIWDLARLEVVATEHPAGNGIGRRNGARVRHRVR